jgi:hypothetical protein
LRATAKSVKREQKSRGLQVSEVDSSFLNEEDEDFKGGEATVYGVKISEILKRKQTSLNREEAVEEKRYVLCWRCRIPVIPDGNLCPVCEMKIRRKRQIYCENPDCGANIENYGTIEFEDPEGNLIEGCSVCGMGLEEARRFRKEKKRPVALCPNCRRLLMIDDLGIYYPGGELGAFCLYCFKGISYKDKITYGENHE